jgi:hypothetical protein
VILRQLYTAVVHRQAWDPVIAAHGTRTHPEVAVASRNPPHARQPTRRASPEPGRGEPYAALRTQRCLVGHQGPTGPVVDTTRSHAAEPGSVTAVHGPTTAQAPAQPLTHNVSR